MHLLFNWWIPKFHCDHAGWYIILEQLWSWKWSFLILENVWKRLLYAISSPNWIGSESHTKNLLFLKTREAFEILNWRKSMIRPVVFGKFLFIVSYPEEVKWNKSIEECLWFNYGYLMHNTVKQTSPYLNLCSSCLKELQILISM